MRKFYLALVAALLFASAAYAASDCSGYNAANCMKQGGNAWVVGGTQAVRTGGTLDIESGGALKIGGTTVSATAAELNYGDVTTLGTAEASKAVTSDASLDTVIPTGGLFTFQSGSGLTLNSGSTFTASGTTVAYDPLINPGRAFFTICGEATTVNNNTVYYGPITTTLTANIPGGQACDIDGAGNTTEATADAPAFGAKAFHVLGMTCRNEADANANISFTLRSAAAATTPSVTCTIADGERDCVADVQTTTAIASGATVAVAAASSSDVGDNNGFICTVSIAY